MRWPAKKMPEWRRWFAWYPVRVYDEWVWWEWVEVHRQVNEGGGFSVRYRLFWRSGTGSW